MMKRLFYTTLFFSFSMLMACSGDTATQGTAKDEVDELVGMASQLEERGKLDIAQIIYGNLANQHADHPQANTFKEKAGSKSPEQIVEEYKKSRLENPDQYGINRSEGFKFVDAAEAFAISAPNHPKTPEYLFDAAEIAKLLRTYDKAISLYDRLIDNHPDYAKTPSALFIKAFTLENELGKNDEAKQSYELFLERYPNDDFADDAQFSLENIGKSPEEVLKAIEAKNKN